MKESIYLDSLLESYNLNNLFEEVPFILSINLSPYKLIAIGESIGIKEAEKYYQENKSSSSRFALFKQRLLDKSNYEEVYGRLLKNFYINVNPVNICEEFFKKEGTKCHEITNSVVMAILTQAAKNYNLNALLKILKSRDLKKCDPICNSLELIYKEYVELRYSFESAKEKMESFKNIYNINTKENGKDENQLQGTRTNESFGCRHDGLRICCSPDQITVGSRFIGNRTPIIL